VGETTAIGLEAPHERRVGLRALFRRRHPEPISFPELVWAHFLRQKEVHEQIGEPYAGPAEERYRRFEAAFEERYGPIVNAYWCSNEASAVALTVQRRPGIIPDVIRLHWATDWAMRDVDELKQILFRCETVTVKVCEVLRDTSKRLAIQRLFNCISYVLGFAETESSRDPKAIRRVVDVQKKELAALEKYYKGAAGRSGQIIYLAGALLGVFVCLGLALVAAVFGLLGHGSAGPTGAVCFAAGAIGALVSVMSRMGASRVNLDWEFGRDTLRTLGSLRPVVGGVFGLVTYFALQSDLVSIVSKGEKNNNFAFYVVFAFVAGFSERFAQDMLLGSALHLGGKRKEPAAKDESEGETPPAGKD
jgi:hypothetical protein